MISKTEMNGEENGRDSSISRVMKKYRKRVGRAFLGITLGGSVAMASVFYGMYRDGAESSQIVNEYHTAQNELERLEIGRSLLSEIAQSEASMEISESEIRSVEDTLAVYNSLTKDRERVVTEFENLDKVKLYNKRQSFPYQLLLCGKLMGGTFLGMLPGLFYYRSVSKKEDE